MLPSHRVWTFTYGTYTVLLIGVVGDERLLSMLRTTYFL
jgi:hypothetical protein